MVTGLNVPLDGPGDCVGMLIGDGHRSVEAGREFENGRTDSVSRSLGCDTGAKELVDAEIVPNGLSNGRGVDASVSAIGGGEPGFVRPVSSTRIAGVAADSDLRRVVVRRSVEMFDGRPSGSRSVVGAERPHRDVAIDAVSISLSDSG
jgi:hypothetical protein